MLLESRASTGLDRQKLKEVLLAFVPSNLTVKSGHGRRTRQAGSELHPRHLFREQGAVEGLRTKAYKSLFEVTRISCTLAASRR